MSEHEMKYFKGPFSLREPKTESEGACIYDADEHQIAMLFWPTHPVEETADAEQETYRLGRLMAFAATNPNLVAASPAEVATPCSECHGGRVVMTKPAGVGHADDLAEYVPCPKCASAGAEVATGEPREKANHIGAPKVFALELACQDICEAFNDYGCYLVGSSLHRPDWRDVDVRFIMPDEDFAVLFPTAGRHWEQNPRWLLLTVAISEHLSKITGLPIDFQFQPQTHANERHKGVRHAIGFKIAAEPK